ncbi:sulfite exporter TauE/SafE family protein [Pseudoalteromonas sp. T1lg23B]|uniref:sulfite exporter TauE/SafE family protein n=1 Tax=Pseudoalteromonas sp. T1lg23B TaxID=2077097 RepID=UPI001319EA10|nr:sulfite exporter TauE/SafE family protein [Pseudoalteromonas sp. T1lg23B]
MQYHRHHTFWLALVLTAGIWLISFLLWWDMTALLSSWKTSLTMLFGSFVAGSTPLGGGAVAFPVFTKVLQVSPYDARTFSLFIQSIGMSFATLYFISRRIFIDWTTIARGLVYATLGQLCAVTLVLTDGLLLKYIFSCFLVLVALLLVYDKQSIVLSPVTLKRLGAFALITFFGGLITGYLGCGADTLLFFYYVLLLGSQAKHMIPTTVTFMALNALLGSLMFFMLGNQPSEFVLQSWFFAAPIVAIGAPLGGYILTKLNASLIVRFIVLVILLESCSSLFLLPLKPVEVAVLCCLQLSVFLLLLVKAKARAISDQS